MPKIYTKTGDNGETGLFNGKRLKKDNPVFDLLGTLDELSAVLGYLHLTKKKKLDELASSVQSDLFEIGSFVAGKKYTGQDIKRFESKLVEVENEIDTIDSQNKSLSNFILAGGSQYSIILHHSRAICRRAERLLVQHINHKKDLKMRIFGRYLNRLSDYLFVLARYYNEKGKKDVVWKSEV